MLSPTLHSRGAGDARASLVSPGGNLRRLTLRILDQAGSTWPPSRAVHLCYRVPAPSAALPGTDVTFLAVCPRDGEKGRPCLPARVLRGVAPSGAYQRAVGLLLRSDLFRACFLAPEPKEAHAGNVYWVRAWKGHMSPFGGATRWYVVALCSYQVDSVGVS